ncbi:MAG TPA: polysaccharide deacetylase family protein [Terriglobales bacterium]|nr:polysaccharide deacetylase family protein [Terriglobales bacterium]
MPLRRFAIAALIFFLAGFNLPAQQKTVAERLGYPAGAKLLILHADDLAVAHSQDAASFDALEKHDASSASVIVPAPWLTEAADYAKAHPDTDVGIHLALTSEWKTYRWGPVAPYDKVPSLLDPFGYLPLTANDVANDKPAQVELELRAQINRAIALGIHPTHLDSHMGALFTKPEFFAIYMKLAHEFHIPFFAVKSGDPQFAPLLSLVSEKDKPFLMDSLSIANPNIPADHWMDFYLNVIKNLRPGLNELIVHLAYDNAETQAIMVDHPDYGAAWRQRDYNVVTSPEFRKALADNHVILITYRDLAKVWNP